MLISRFPGLLFVAVLIALSLSAGCDRPPKPPLDRVVEAVSEFGFEAWRSNTTADFTPDQKVEFDNAVQELRFKLMANGVSGTVGLNAAFCAEVNGRTVRQVLGLGLAAKLQRLEQRRAAMDAILGGNAQLVTRPGDTVSAEYLEQKRTAQTAQRDAAGQEIEAIRARLVALGQPVPEGQPYVSPAPPTPAPAASAEPDSMPELLHK